MSEEEDQKHIAAFEKAGVARVQALVNQNQYTGHRGVLAGQWLDEKAAAAKAEDTNLQRRAVEASETQAGEAKKATKIALVSLAIAVLALIVAALALFNDWKAAAPGAQRPPATEAPSPPPVAPAAQPAAESPAARRSPAAAPPSPH